jgi:hypothetical protein
MLIAGNYWVLIDIFGFFIMVNGLIQNEVINPLCNMNGIFIEKLSEKVSGFS